MAGEDESLSFQKKYFAQIFKMDLRNISVVSEEQKAVETDPASGSISGKFLSLIVT